MAYSQIAHSNLIISNFIYLGWLLQHFLKAIKLYKALSLFGTRKNEFWLYIKCLPLATHCIQLNPRQVTKFLLAGSQFFRKVQHIKQKEGSLSWVLRIVLVFIKNHLNHWRFIIYKTEVSELLQDGGRGRHLKILFKKPLLILFFISETLDSYWDYKDLIMPPRYLKYRRTRVNSKLSCPLQSAHCFYGISSIILHNSTVWAYKWGNKGPQRPNEEWSGYLALLLCFCNVFLRWLSED